MLQLITDVNHEFAAEFDDAHRTRWKSDAREVNSLWHYKVTSSFMYR